VAEMVDIVRNIRISLAIMVDLHLKLITRSGLTLAIVDKLALTLFMLYCKLFFSAGEVGRKEG
jgi:hypothetical protein